MSLLVIELELFSTELYNKTWNTLTYITLIKSYTEWKKLWQDPWKNIKTSY